MQQALQKKNLLAKSNKKIKLLSHKARFQQEKLKALRTGRTEKQEMTFKLEETLKLAEEDPMIQQKLKIFFVVSFSNLLA